MQQASEDLLKEHYIDLKDRPFFAGLVKYMQSGPVVAMVSVRVWDSDVGDSVGSQE